MATTDTSYQSQTKSVLHVAGSDPTGYLGRLTPSEQETLDEFRKQLDSANPGHGQTDRDLLRYLRAREFKLDKSLPMIQKTLQWRSEMKPSETPLETIREFYDRGETLPAGKDLRGRPVVWTFNKHHNPEMADLAVQNHLYLFERLIKEMPEGEETIVSVFDLTGYTMANKDDKWRKNIINAFQNHYPERMGMFIIINPPPIFGVIWWMIRMLMPKRTTQKFEFIKGTPEQVKEKLLELFPEDSIPQHLGGTQQMTPQKWIEQQLGPAPPTADRPWAPENMDTKKKGWLSGWAKYCPKAPKPKTGISNHQHQI